MYFSISEVIITFNNAGFVYVFQLSFRCVLSLYHRSRNIFGH